MLDNQLKLTVHRLAVRTRIADELADRDHQSMQVRVAILADIQRAVFQFLLKDRLQGDIEQLILIRVVGIKGSRG